MIAFFLGLPGSGKTYFSVNTIYNNFTDNLDVKKDLKKDYLSCYTNINQFNYNKCNNIFELDFDDLYKKLSKLYDLKKKGANDDELIEKAKEFNLYKTLFVIDECHDKFDSQDKILVWWLTYHRHLYHDIFLITQSLSLVHAKYKPLAEAFYKAKPLSLILGNKNFKYDYYIESRLNKASYVNTISVKKNDNVFKLYKSGDSVDNKNVIVRFIIITLVLLVVLFSFAYYFYYSTESKTKLQHKNISASSSIVSKTLSNASYNIVDTDNNIDTDNLVYMSIICSETSCRYQNKYFSVKLLAFAKDNYSLKIIDSQTYFHSLNLSIIVSKEFLNLLQGASNEENIQNNPASSFLGQ
jgi:zona occludens toxin